MEKILKLIGLNKNFLVITQITFFGFFLLTSLFTTLTTTVANEAFPYTRIYYRSGDGLELNTLFQFILYLTMFNLHYKTNKFERKSNRISLFLSSFINFVLILIISITYYTQWLYRHFFSMTLDYSWNNPGRIITYSTNTFGHLMNISIIILLVTSIIFMTYYFTLYLKTSKEYPISSKEPMILADNPKDAAIKIRDLKKLLDEGIISKEVFDEKSKKYIEEL